ncbi:MAG: hypothetical protein J2P22_14245 [Nocardioides sp.]|nr:hypothetical protein [Nocardioides sp.]
MGASFRFATQVALAALFLVSSVGKLRAGRLVIDLANYRLLPLRAVVPLATLLPYFELAIALLLVAQPARVLPLYLSAGLLTLFAGAMSVNLVRGNVVACGCRATSKPISWALVSKNLSLAVAAVLTASFAPPPQSLSLSVSIATALTVGFGGLVWQLVAQARDLSTRLKWLEVKPVVSQRSS